MSRIEGKLQSLGVALHAALLALLPGLADAQLLSGERITGSGVVKTLWAKDALNATIAGSGQIKYYGTPQLNQTMARSGSIRRAGDAS